jgi:hypothetical protein
MTGMKHKNTNETQNIPLNVIIFFDLPPVCRPLGRVQNILSTFFFAKITKMTYKSYYKSRQTISKKNSGIAAGRLESGFLEINLIFPITKPGSTALKDVKYYLRK